MGRSNRQRWGARVYQLSVYIFGTVIATSVSLYLLFDIWPFLLGLNKGPVKIYPRLVFGPVFIFHWGVIFITYREYYSRTFTRLSTVGLLVVAFLLGIGFISLPAYDSAPSGDYLVFYISIASVGTVYVIVDILNAYLNEGIAIRRGITFIHGCLFLWGSTYALGLAFGVFGDEKVHALVFVGGTYIASAAFLSISNS